MGTLPNLPPALAASLSFFSTLSVVVFTIVYLPPSATAMSTQSPWPGASLPRSLSSWAWGWSLFRAGFSPLRGSK